MADFAVAAMSRRESVYAKKLVYFQSPPSPNSTVDLITVELRLFFPPNATQDVLLGHLSEVYADAVKQVLDSPIDLLPSKVWLVDPRE